MREFDLWAFPRLHPNRQALAQERLLGFGKLRPKAAVMLIGTNNTGHLQRPAEETAAGIRAVIGEFHKHLPQTPLVLLAIFPRGQRPDDPLRRLNDEINAKAALLADGRRVIHLDLASRFLDAEGALSHDVMPDFLHLAPAAYERWAEGLLPLLKGLGVEARD